MTANKDNTMMVVATLCIVAAGLSLGLAEIALEFCVSTCGIIKPLTYTTLMICGVGVVAMSAIYLNSQQD